MSPYRIFVVSNHEMRLKLVKQQPRRDRLVIEEADLLVPFVYAYTMRFECTPCILITASCNVRTSYLF
jgi:hypothetical protein